MKRWSLRRRLSLAVVAAVTIVIACFSLVLDAAFERSLWREFDGRLIETARRVAGTLEEAEDGDLEVEPATVPLPEPTDATWFEVWTDRGEVVLRNLPEGQADLQRQPTVLRPIFVDLQSPGGQQARSLQLQVEPHTEAHAEAPPSGRMVTVVVVRDTVTLRQEIADFRKLMAGAGVAAFLLAALLSLLAVRGALGVLDDIGAQIERIDSSHLGDRLKLDDLPSEVVPAGRKLNELLQRLEASFERERRFNEDVSHELRTPLSGLLGILELAAARERTPAEYREAIERATQVTRDMRRLVINILELARAESSALEIRKEPVPLRELVDVTFAAVSDRAQARKLKFTNQVDEAATMQSDAGLMRVIVSNLVSNAVDYTDEGGWITAESAPADGIVVAITDSGPALTSEQRERVFQRFVRLDGARTHGAHHGIGLSLVRALTEQLGLVASAEARQDGAISFVVRTRAQGGAQL
ncbi:MAG: hypothetical protein JST92_10245 [Deltaproteobacteria bacterium]|nr:hypothetical protein [Deltaproteobacteria bacterium]